MKKLTYEPPRVEVWRLEANRGLNLLASLSMGGNISDFEAGTEDDLIEDNWDAF